MGRTWYNGRGGAGRSYYKVVATFFVPVLALLERMQQHPGARVQQTMKAFVGLGVMIIVPTVLVWWARKKYRP